MARNELKEPTSKSDASGAKANRLTFDFPECNAVELNDYNNGSSSSEPQIITNLETVLISSIPHFADLSEQRTNTDLPEQQLVTGEHIFPKSLHPLIQLEKDAVTASFLEKIDGDPYYIIEDDITDSTALTPDWTILEFTDLSEQRKESDSLIQSEQDAGTKSSLREIDGKQSEMEQEHSDPDYIEENDTDNTDSSDVEDEDSASIGEAEAEENVYPSYGGELSKDLRRQLKALKDKQDHEVKPGCGMKCKKKGSQNVPEERRRDINTQFWD
ncbi:hypothetical protein JTB14_010408 [Gonioctena quinquepunctata]|nr:hypothetical protein JTB14_010408 [Gonioctena quinquepunctata]